LIIGFIKAKFHLSSFLVSNLLVASP